MNYATGLRILFGLGSVAVVVLDQVTKNLVMTRMTLYSSVPVIPGVFHLTLITNTGALFGLFRDFAQPARSLLFTMVPLLAIVLIIVFQYRTSMNDVIAQTGLALILGGAVGNLVDRVRFGYVIDFLDVFIGEHHWPAFNVADSSICVGVSLLFIDLMRRGPRAGPADAHPGG